MNRASRAFAAAKLVLGLGSTSLIGAISIQFWFRGPADASAACMAGLRALRVGPWPLLVEYLPRYSPR